MGERGLTPLGPLPSCTKFLGGQLHLRPGTLLSSLQGKGVGASSLMDSTLWMNLRIVKFGSGLLIC